MSLCATPLLYVNMGGEMLYILRQRLKAQRIDVEKTVKVLNDVTAALISPRILAKISEKSPMIDILALRSTLECIALCSIMKLDQNSLDRLFDLMLIMVKYQLTAATGPREVVLLTLNHTDAMRGMVSDVSTQECIDLLHQLILDIYGPLTLDEIWEARNECLTGLQPYCVRVSILLRLGLQNDDGSFNLAPQKYDERYEERRDDVCHLKLRETEDDKRYAGSLNVIGDRGTILGKNIYSPTYGVSNKPQSKRLDQHFLADCATKAELGMLAVQLGTERICERPFTLNLFSNEEPERATSVEEKFDGEKVTEDNNKAEKTKLNQEYKNKLDSVCTDFVNIDDVKRNMSLLDLLDQVE